MEAEDVINLSASSNSGAGSGNNELRNSDYGFGEADSQPSNFQVKEDKIERETIELNKGDVENEDSHIIEETDRDKNSVDDSSIMQMSVELTETITVPEKLRDFSPRVHAESCCPSVQNESPSHNHKMDVSSLSGVKRARITFDEEQPSVHVTYSSLTRASKRKLEELLQQWSEWQAQHGSSSKDPNEVTESGEETYFPALRVGMEKSSAVSFWIDNQTMNQQNKGFIPLDSNSVPLYDRGYASVLTSVDGSSNLERGLEIVDDANRCFNCGSYNHSLKECPKPRDNVAVNNARKQRKSRRNQNPSSRNPTRYYQNSSGGKYDGLRPGALDAETRQLLGLGELDPPPWLNRMREMGYPPGYLDADDEDQPSGIIIYADGEVKQEQEDGEIIETDRPEQPKKMAVEFPGINGPIPENADERLWAARPSSSDASRGRSHRRLNHSSELTSREHHREQRWPWDFRDDGPPGVDPAFSPPISSYPPRYGGYDSSYNSHSPRDHIPMSRSPTLGRSQSDRGRRSPLVYEDFASHDPYTSSPYSSVSRRGSFQDYGAARFEHETDERRDDYNLDHSSRRMDELNGHRHRSSRW